MIEKSIGFIGAGQMARALANGFVQSKQVAPDRLGCFDPSERATEEFQGLLTNAHCHASNAALVDASEIVFVAVKPQFLENVFQDLKPSSTAGKLIVSVVAGATCAYLTAGFRTDRVIRVMPNTPALVGNGASGYCRGNGASQADAAVTRM